MDLHLQQHLQQCFFSDSVCSLNLEACWLQNDTCQFTLKKKNVSEQTTFYIVCTTTDRGSTNTLSQGLGILPGFLKSSRTLSGWEQHGFWGMSFQRVDVAAKKVDFLCSDIWYLIERVQSTLTLPEQQYWVRYR